MANSIENFLNGIFSEPEYLTGSTDLPDTPWIKLDDLERFLIGARLIPTDDDSRVFSEIDKWVTACGFSGVQFMGVPVIAHSDDALGPLKEIPTTYFRRLRGVYGAQGLSRLPVDMPRDRQEAANREDEGGFGEPDWQEVLIQREGLVSYIKRSGATVADIATGAPGRPTPMHLVKLEHARRVDQKQSLPKKSDEALYLAGWLKRQFPTVPPLTAKTIKNRLAEASHRQI